MQELTRNQCCRCACCKSDGLVFLDERGGGAGDAQLLRSKPVFAHLERGIEAKRFVDGVAVSRHMAPPWVRVTKPCDSRRMRSRRMLAGEVPSADVRSSTEALP